MYVCGCIWFSSEHAMTLIFSWGGLLDWVKTVYTVKDIRLEHHNKHLNARQGNIGHTK